MKSILPVVFAGVLFTAISGGLGHDLIRNNEWIIKGALYETVVAVLGPPTQWMVVAVSGIYYSCFSLWVYLGRRILASDIVFTVFIAWSFLRYFASYSADVDEYSFVILSFSAAVGRGAAVWIQYDSASEPNRRKTLTYALTGMIVISSIYQIDAGRGFLYRNQRRWSGIWENPNICGLVLGVGIILVIGELLMAGNKDRIAWKRWTGAARAGFLIVSALSLGCMLVALLHTYSRGAWAAVCIGLSYLALTAYRPKLMLRSRISSLFVIFSSLFIICSILFKGSENIFVRRLLSVANFNDHSWRNRISSWEATANMMADNPLYGFGWGRAVMFCNLYKEQRVVDAIAIQMNDYLMIGVTLGIPALCLFYYGIMTIIFQSSESYNYLAGAAETRITSAAVARAAVVTLSIGMAFDGGIFVLPTGVLFWVLCELGSERCATQNTCGHNNRIVGPQLGRITLI